MIIYRSIDIEDKLRGILSGHMTAYCRPLPKDFTVPSILITHTGGSSMKTVTGKGKADIFMVVLDGMAETEAEADELLRNAVAILEADDSMFVDINSLYSWGTDPVRPDLAMCSATITVTAHREISTITEVNNGES